MALATRALSAFGKIGIIIAIAVAFVFGLAGTVYLSLRSPEVKVPDVLGQNRLAAEEAIHNAGLNIRVRATRAVADAKPDVIILQTPRAGEMVKAGQTISVDVSRTAKEGESAITVASITDNKKEENKQEKSEEKVEDKGASAAAQNDNKNANENKPKKNKNANNANNSNANARNSNAANSATNGNTGANSNRNLNNRNAANANANRTVNNRNANLNVNRNSNNLNINRRAPVSTPPFVSPDNRRTP
ncbi:MAG TPA: PASTA domain-containing protein [Pyrinomonadaceae bacterium]